MISRISTSVACLTWRRVRSDSSGNRRNRCDPPHQRCYKARSFQGFPETQVRELHRTFKGRNPFADRLLLDLVLQNMIVFGVQRLVRERMMSEFNIKPNIAGMIEAALAKRSDWAGSAGCPAKSPHSSEGFGRGDSRLIRKHAVLKLPDVRSRAYAPTFISLRISSTAAIALMISSSVL